MEKNNEIKEILLFSSSNELEIEQVCSILKKENIPFIRKDYGSGAYMNIYMGQSVQEKRIFVNKDDYEHSLELISSFISNDNNIELKDKEDDYNYTKKYINIRRALVILCLILPICLIFLAIILYQYFMYF